MPFGHWTKEQVEDLLRKEQFRYQRIELPYGLATSGQDRSSTAIRIFPDSLAGKSVLDLGCSSGYFCFEAAKRGAIRVLGIDVEPDVIRKNRLLADCLGLNVEFQVHDIEATLPDEQFDYVLCLNVLHHLVNPLSVLDNLVMVTCEYLDSRNGFLGCTRSTLAQRVPHSWSCTDEASSDLCECGHARGAPQAQEVLHDQERTEKYSRIPSTRIWPREHSAVRTQGPIHRNCRAAEHHGTSGRRRTARRRKSRISACLG